jgi:hypothetical protein
MDGDADRHSQPLFLMQLPINTRAEILIAQAETIAAHYAQTQNVPNHPLQITLKSNR